jgi:putative ABC transport system permease protein
MLEEHIRPLRSLAIVLPTIFLLVAAFLVNIVLSRIIATQREQVGLLKAFGYSSARVAVHYLELTLLLVIPGVALALPVGAWLGRLFATFYAGFFRFPVLVFRVYPTDVLAAALVAVVAAGAGAFGSVRRVVALPPVVAMTPEIPAFRGSILDLAGLSRLFPPGWRMVLRNVTRRPLRSALGVGGMALAVTIVTLGSSVGDSFDRMRDIRFQAAEREDIIVSLAHVRAVGTTRDFLALPGVRRAEPFRVVPARLLGRSRVHDITLFGLPEGGQLRRAVGSEYRTATIGADGAVVTEWLADQFGLRRGDLLSLEIRENRRRTVASRLIDVVDEPLGNAA